MKQIIDSLGMTLYQFSKHYNIPYTTVLQWYKGKRKPPAYVITLFKEKLERDKKGQQLEIPIEKIYFCYDTDKKRGIECCYRGKYIDSVKKWIENSKGINRHIDIHHVIKIYEEEEFKDIE